ncbi:MAG: hypothetical protein JWR30_1504 [Conexibacter sp.]|jgi:uncharacterized membrane protein HdeD (DUF308 family)|nr:hypothetical protein [Conexibacter sp.]MCZ4493730.1 hypothetical protein [Conexibacter sp.]MDX6714526.1 hypothetical protein [Baekduia sp.]MDX6730223.1 hypothetical protein [Baekduia sp.]
MAKPRDVHRQTTLLFSSVMVLLGVAMIVRTVAGGGSALALGLLLGVLFVAAGAGRIYLALRPGRSREKS